MPFRQSLVIIHIITKKLHELHLNVQIISHLLLVTIKQINDILLKLKQFGNP